MSVWAANNWVILLIGVVAAFAVAFVLTEDAAVSRRVFRRFIFNIALPMFVLLGGPVIWFAATAQMEPRILQAVIAGLVIAAGWLTTAIFTELARVRAKDEKTRDYHKAIYAEIRHTLDVFYADGKYQEMTNDILSRMENDPKFEPFIPLESHDRVFTALVDGIEALPRQTIDAVVAYYSVISSFEAFAQDMRGDGFKKLSKAQRIGMYKDYVDMRIRAFRYGNYALSLIKAYSEGGAEKADKVAEEKRRSPLNTPDAGHPAHRDSGTE